MTSCPKCGFENKAGKFCIKCGSKLFEMTPEVSAQVDILKKRIERDSLNPKLYLELADIYHQNNMMPEALLEYQKVLNLDNSMYDVHLNCGDIYFKTKDFEKAQASYEKALAINPDLPKVKIALFNVHRLKDDFDKAIKAGEEILFSQPANIEIHKSLKDIYLRRERYQDAMRELETLSNLAPNDIEVLKELAQRYELHDKNEKAFAIYQKLQALQPDDLKTVFFLGKYYCLSGNHEKCIKYLKPNVAKMSEQMHSSANLYLALCSINQGNLEAASKHITGVTSLYDEELTASEKQLYGETYYKIGRIRFQSNDFAHAIESFSIASKYDSQNQEYKKELELARSKRSAIQDRLKSKRLKIGLTVILGVIVITATWLLTHGRIQVEISPTENAQLYLDGMKLNEITIVKQGVLLSPSIFFGEYMLALEKDGYEKWNGTVSVGLGKTVVIPIHLTPIYGSLELLSLPYGAEVYLDGIYKGKTPLRDNGILATEHELTLKSENYKPYTTTVRIKAGKKLLLGPIELTNITGLWKGLIFTEKEVYKGGRWLPLDPNDFSNYEFNMNITQSGDSLRISYHIKPRDYGGWRISPGGNGTILCLIKEMNITATDVNYQSENSSMSTRPKTLEGIISQNWDRIDGTVEYYNAGLSLTNFRTKWWVTREPSPTSGNPSTSYIDYTPVTTADSGFKRQYGVGEEHSTISRNLPDINHGAQIGNRDTTAIPAKAEDTNYVHQDLSKFVAGSIFFSQDFFKYENGVAPEGWGDGTLKVRIGPDGQKYLSVERHGSFNVSQSVKFPANFEFQFNILHSSGFEDMNFSFIEANGNLYTITIGENDYSWHVQLPGTNSGTFRFDDNYLPYRFSIIKFNNLLFVKIDGKNVIFGRCQNVLPFVGFRTNLVWCARGFYLGKFLGKSR